MADAPAFRKHDRYKASSYRAYNFKMPKRYDSSFWMSFCQVPLCDRTVMTEVGPEIDSLRILDVGCATGRLLLSLASAGGKDLSGVDIAPRILEVAHQKLAAAQVSAELRAADAEDAIPWPSESFDVATLTGVLHHFYRPYDALQEIGRVLRPGGRIILIDPCLFVPVRQLVNLALRAAPHDGDFRFYSPRGAARIVEKVAFRCSEVRRVGLWTYLIVAVRGDKDTWHPAHPPVSSA